MSNLPEQPVWEDGIYQIEDSDVSSGGEDGLFNVQPKALANRTAWLKRQLENMTLAVRMADADGDVHDMVYVPRFTVLAGSLGVNRPSRNMELGGFLVDMYPNLVDGSTKACSQPMAAPAFGASLGGCQAAAGNRSVSGGGVHVMTAVEWGHLGWLVEVYGRMGVLRGPLDGQIDPRDAEDWAAAGVEGTDGLLTGSGPLSWRHNGRYDGIDMLIGGWWHHLQAHPVGGYGGFGLGGCALVREAELAEAIDDVETTFLISSPQGFELWPTANGLLVLDQVPNREWMTYSQLVVDPGDPTVATISLVERGAYYGGGTGVAHLLGARVLLQQNHHLVPGGWRGFCLAGGLNNTTDPVTFTFGLKELVHGTQDASPSPGDVFCVLHDGNYEDLVVTEVVGEQITATRGANGTPVAAHPGDIEIASYSPAMTRVGVGQMEGVQTGALRQHQDLEEMRFPAAVSPAGAAGAPRLFIDLRIDGSRGLLRGGSRVLGRGTTLDEMALGGLAISLDEVGFRCGRDPQMGR